MAHTNADTNRSEQSIGELAKQLSDQTSRLVRQEVELAKAELGEKARSAGIGAGMFGGAGMLGLYALGALTAAAILALATAVAAWLGALIVAAVYGAIAGILAMTGKTRMRRATPPMPQEALQSAKEDVEWTKERVSTARR
jgi:hypothetical protein